MWHYVQDSKLLAQLGDLKFKKTRQKRFVFKEINIITFGMLLQYKTLYKLSLMRIQIFLNGYSMGKISNSMLMYMCFVPERFMQYIGLHGVGKMFGLKSFT